jgi:hypothetical protein
MRLRSIKTVKGKYGLSVNHTTNSKQDDKWQQLNTYYKICILYTQLLP